MLPSETEARLNAFFDDPEDLNRLPLDATDHLSNIQRQPDAAGMAVFAFDIREAKGKGNKVGYRVNPAELAFLLTAEHLGASPFINYANRKPYLKVGGGMDKKAGITAGRLFAGYEEGEDAPFLNKDVTDLTHCNLGSRNNPRTERGQWEIIVAILVQSPDDPTLQRNKRLLFRALDCLDAERDTAVSLKDAA